MAQITEKELTALGDLMEAESVFAEKYAYCAKMTDDAQLKDCFLQTEKRHKQHLDQLYANVK